MRAALKLVRQDSSEVRSAVRSVCWAARDLGLLDGREFERIANLTVEQMGRDELQALAGAARRLARILDQESAARP